MAEILAHHTRQPMERVERDIDRDFYMTAEQARDYGIVDEIIAPRRGIAAPRPAREAGFDETTVAAAVS